METITSLTFREENGISATGKFTLSFVQKKYFGEIRTKTADVLRL